jgi:hypothetical protein
MEFSLALAATAVVETQVGQAVGVAGFCQTDLLWGIAIGKQAVATDHHRRVTAPGQMKGPGQFESVGIKMDRLFTVQQASLLGRRGSSF